MFNIKQYWSHEANIYNIYVLIFDNNMFNELSKIIRITISSFFYQTIEYAIIFSKNVQFELNGFLLEFYLSNRKVARKDISTIGG